MTKAKKGDWKEERPVYLILAFTGITLAIVCYFIPKNIRDVQEGKLAVINNIVLDKSPEIENNSRRNSERILLHIENYSKPFQVSGFDYSETIKRNIIQDIKLRDTITVKIDSSEFRKIGSITVFDGYIEIKSLMKNGKEYLNINQANSKAKSDLELGVPLGIYLMIAGFVYWTFKVRPMLSPAIIIGGGILFIILMM